jgi:hypothetical protein
MSNLVIRVPQSLLLPDNGQWTNRFYVKSESSDRLYVVSQNKTKRHWGCSCPSYRVRRYCKHLTSIGLPTDEQPYEALLQAS